jgi:hypothetical protein
MQTAVHPNAVVKNEATTDITNLYIASSSYAMPVAEPCMALAKARGILSDTLRNETEQIKTSAMEAMRCCHGCFNGRCGRNLVCRVNDL